VSRKFAVIVATLSIAAACEVDAQLVEPPARDAGVSVVIRCNDCGTIESIREVQETRAALTPGTAPASPIGLVMYVPIGRKAGAEQAYVGSVGTRQWQERTASARYEFTVRMDDGSYRFIPRQGVSDFAVSNRVKVTQLEIEHFTQ